MKNKMTKMALTLGTVASVVAPMAAVISCGSDDSHDDTVVIKYTWAANGAQIKALQPVVAYYNSKVAKKDDFKVKLVHVEGGYGKAVELDGRDMSMGHMGPVADAIIDYPDSLGQLASKSLDFGKDADGKDNGIKGLFDSEDYLTENVEHTDGAGVYSLPLAKSTEMLSIDVPMMAAFEKAHVITTAGKVKAAVDDYTADTANEAEIDAIVTSLGDVVAPLTPIAITDEVVSDYDKLMVAADGIAKAAANIAPKKTMHVFGEDSPTNLMYQLYNARAGYDKDKFLFHEDKDGKFDYSALKDKTSEGGKIVDGLLKEIQTHVASGSLVINGAGAYSSSDFVDHKLPFVIGSTAGFAHNFKVQGAFGVKPATGAVVPLSGHNAEISAPTDALKTKGAIAMTIDKYHNPVWGSTYAGTPGEHDYQVKDAATDKLVAAAIAAKETMVLKSGAKEGDANLVNKGTFHYTFVSGKKVTVAKSKDTKHVNPEEVLSLVAPVHSNTPTGVTAKTQILSQGPSFIGIKHGGKKDAQTIKFMSWFFNKDSKIIDESGNSTSPVEAFDIASGYITPIADAFDAKNRAKYKEGNLVAFDAFAEVNNDNGVAFDNPVSRFSSDVRDSTETALKTIYTNAHGGKNVATPDELYGRFSKSFDLD